MRSPCPQCWPEDDQIGLSASLDAWAARRPALVEAARLGKLHEEAENAARTTRTLLLEAVWIGCFSDAAAEAWRAAVHAEAIAENVYLDAVWRSDEEDQRARLEEQGGCLEHRYRK